MNGLQSLGLHERILVVGFNCRPIARSASQFASEIGAIDYFGDDDLTDYCTWAFSAVRQSPGQFSIRPNRPLSEIFTNLALIMIDEVGVFDTVVIGGGFDDKIDVWKQLETCGKHLAATPYDRIPACRDRLNLYKEAKRLGLPSPSTVLTDSSEEALEFFKQMSAPIVVKSSSSGGGTNIFLCSTAQEVLIESSQLLESTERRIYCQEFIEGIPASASILAIKDSAQVISYNTQIIGEKSSRSPSRFAYCGNVVPGMFSEAMKSEIETKFAELCCNFGLLGSVGIDFVVHDGVPVIMEINPRPQGTLEPWEFAYGENLLQWHISATKGRLDADDLLLLPSTPKTRCVKKILFVGDNPILVPEFSKEIRDRPPPNAWLGPGEPLCTILEVGENIAELLSRVNQQTEIVFTEVEASTAGKSPPMVIQ